MCGIIGYVGPRDCKALLLQGLERLEYRGYDSAGIALREQDGLDYVRAVGNLQNLKHAAGPNGSPSTHGLGHTRWATHGAVTERTRTRSPAATTAKLSIVLNGIVENYRELSERLIEAGHTFTSETDAEVVVHLIERRLRRRPDEAVRKRVRRSSRGTSRSSSSTSTTRTSSSARRSQTPLVVGIGEGEMFLASNAAAFLARDALVQFIDDHEVVDGHAGGRDFMRPDGSLVEHERVELDWDDEGAEKGGYETFMLKEIYEQPEAIAETIGDRVRHGKLVLEGLGLDRARDPRPAPHRHRRLRHGVPRRRRRPLHDRGVGPHPGRARHRLGWIYRNPVLDEDTLVIGISQSGETRDTIHAMQLAREHGARTRRDHQHDGHRRSRARPTRCSTRAAGSRSASPRRRPSRRRSRCSPWSRSSSPRCGRRCRRRRSSSSSTGSTSCRRRSSDFLDGDHPVDEIAQRFYDRPFFLYLGRHIGLPVALEGALKLKEICYIPTEAYSAGEMKHGPIALLDAETPVVVVATDIHVYDKIVSNIQEMRARGAHVIAIATDGNEDIQHHADDVIYVPQSPAFLQAALAVVPLQLLAYRIARLRGLNVDQPRNLAKTVTVE